VSTDIIESEGHAQGRSERVPGRPGDHRTREAWLKIIEKARAIPSHTGPPA
jgi:hypothetical protein